MRSPIWVETLLCLILDRNEDFADFLSSWFSAFAMGSPFSGQVCCVGLRTRSERSPFSEPYSKILRDEVTLWVECAPRYTLDRERRIYLVVSPRSFRMGSPFLGSSRMQLIASEGLSWFELMAAYCSTLLHWSMLVRMCYI